MRFDITRTIRCCERGPGGWITEIYFARFVPLPEIRTVILEGWMVLRGDGLAILFLLEFWGLMISFLIEVGFEFDGVKFYEDPYQSLILLMW